MAKENGKPSKEDSVQIVKMEPGELQLRKAFEETTIHNVRLCVNHANSTRILTRELEEKVKHLQNIVINRDAQIDQMQKQIANLLQEKYKGGS